MTIGVSFGGRGGGGGSPDIFNQNFFISNFFDFLSTDLKTLEFFKQKRVFLSCVAKVHQFRKKKQFDFDMFIE